MSPNGWYKRRQQYSSTSGQSFFHFRQLDLIVQQTLTRTHRIHATDWVISISRKSRCWSTDLFVPSCRVLYSRMRFQVYVHRLHRQKQTDKSKKSTKHCIKLATIQQSKSNHCKHWRMGSKSQWTQGQCSCRSSTTQRNWSFCIRFFHARAPIWAGNWTVRERSQQLWQLEIPLDLWFLHQCLLLESLEHRLLHHQLRERSMFFHTSLRAWPLVLSGLD